MQKETTAQPYKPPKEIAEAIRRQQFFQEQQKLHQRRASYLPKRNWIQRNPRVFQGLFITGSLLVFFSKPLYDCFLAPTPEFQKPLPPHKR